MTQMPATTQIRSVCIVSREFPPDTAYGGIARLVHMQAHALAAAGIAVHVVTLAPDGAERTVLDGGVVVHRVAQPSISTPADMGYAIAGVWSHVVAAKVAELDALVRFDVIQAQDYHAETLHLQRRPETPLAIYLNAPMKVVDGGCGRPTTVGQRAFAELEGIALRGADLLLHPTELVLAETRKAFGADLPPAVLVPHQVDVARFACPGREPWDGGVLRVLFLGRLEPLKGPDLALRAIAAARRRGVDARITLVGRDVAQPDGSSYRRGVLIPLMEELGLDFGDVRFVEQVDEHGVAQHLRHAHCALLPSRIENFHTAAVEALAAGLPVVTSDRSGLVCWVGPEDGLRPIPIAETDVFAEGAAAALADAAWIREAGFRGAAHVPVVFDAAEITRHQLAAYAAQVEARAAAAPALSSPPAATHAGAGAAGSELAVIVLAHNALPFTQRCLHSLLAHTDTRFRVLLVDNASTDGTAEWAGALDSRVTVVRSEVNLGVSGGRNAGLAAIEGEPDYIVFLDNDVEVLAGWWRPFAAALERDPEAGIAGEQGIAITVLPDRREILPIRESGVVECDMVIGFCMFIRARAVRTIGRFDENMSIFWHDDDYGMRARHLGWRVLHVLSRRVIHFEHKSSSLVDGIWAAPERPTELSDRNQAYLAEKWATQRAAEGATVLAYADELIEAPELLVAYARAVGAADGAVLAIYAPDWDPGALGAALEAPIAAAGLDADGAPELVAYAIPRDGRSELTMAHRLDALLTRRAPAGVFGAVPHVGAADGELLAEIIGRRERARGLGEAFAQPPSFDDRTVAGLCALVVGVGEPTERA